MSSVAEEQIKGHFEFVYPHGDGLLVIGWCSASEEEVSHISIVLGLADDEKHKLLSEVVRYNRPDVADTLKVQSGSTSYGFVAAFSLDGEEIPEIVGLSLVAEADEAIETAILEPGLGAEETIKANWHVLSKAIGDASYTLDMYSAYENLVTRFGVVEPSVEVSKSELEIPLTQDFRATFEFAYPHGDGLLVMGWCSILEGDALDRISIILGISDYESRVTLSDCVRYFRPDVANELGKSPKPRDAQYGFIATFVVGDALSVSDIVGVSFKLNQFNISQGKGIEAEDDIVGMTVLVPKRAAAEETIKANWHILSKAIGDASYTLDMYSAYENLVTRFGVVEMPMDLSGADLEVNPIRMAIDVCARVSDKAMLICGWVFSLHPREPIADLTITDEYNMADATSFWHQAIRLPRVDVVEGFDLKGPRNQPLGFLCFIEDIWLDAKRASITASTIEGQSLTEVKEVLELSANPIALSEYLFSLFPLQDDKLRRLLDDHVGPAIYTTWQTYREVTKYENSDITTEVLGEEPKNPEVSILIPLYKRYDFVEYQLSQFALDPYMSTAEIIYINDDPEIHMALLNYCRANQPIYNVPFKVVHAGRNLGYAGANNLGASVAKADTLLLLNSDVMPKRPGWLPRMLQSYTSKDDMGALGVRLLYEDESIQHDGMRFVPYDYFQGMWICEHPAKGLSSSLKPATKGLLEVEAVTGACLMIAAELYKQVGGLDENYILGDFEDSDLCLKLYKQGLKTYLNAEVELYHLERQSQNLFSNSDWKAKLTAYNCWQHTERWHDTITDLKEAKVLSE